MLMLPNCPEFVVTCRCADMIVVAEPCFTRELIPLIIDAEPRAAFCTSIKNGGEETARVAAPHPRAQSLLCPQRRRFKPGRRQRRDTPGLGR